MGAIIMPNDTECRILVWDDQTLVWLGKIAEQLNKVRPHWDFRFKPCDQSAISENDELQSDWEKILDKRSQGEEKTIWFDVYHSRGAEKVNYADYCMLVTDAKLETTYPATNRDEYGIQTGSRLSATEKEQYGVRILAKTAIEKNSDISILCASHCMPEVQDKLEAMEGADGRLLAVIDKGDLENNKALVECLAYLIISAVLRWDKVTENKRLTDTNSALAAKVRGDLVGESETIKNIRTEILEISDSPANVLILGKSGTGKELVAKALHKNSSRREKAFVACNCAAFSPSLLESELFGHEKGAFTGALDKRVGRLEEAEGGTLFLDEVGDFSPEVQVKLLRVIQEREYERVGSSKTIKADVRIIAATNNDLLKKVGMGSFRADLYYRLNVIALEMPPLNDRIGDVEILANYFLNITAARCKKEQITGFSNTSLQLLRNHTWPGNVRELQNVIECAVTYCKGTKINPEHLKKSQSFSQEVPTSFCTDDVGCSLSSLPQNLIDTAFTCYAIMDNKDQDVDVDEAVQMAASEGKVPEGDETLLKLLISGIFFYRHQKKKNGGPKDYEKNILRPEAKRIFDCSAANLQKLSCKEIKRLPSDLRKAPYIDGETVNGRTILRELGRRISGKDSVA